MQDDRCEGYTHYGCACTSCPSCDRLAIRVEQLEKALADAIEFADEGWAYADKYFQTKWEYPKERDRLADILKRNN